MNPQPATRFIRLLVDFTFVLIIFSAFKAQQVVQAAPSDIQVTIIAAPNIIVDSNVLTPSTQAPEVATVIGRFCNTSGSTLNNVIGYIGDFNATTPASSTPGTYPSKTNPGIFTGTYSFTHLGGTTDAIRIIGNLAAGQCSYQYWSFTYPKTALSGVTTIPSWGNSVNPSDDLSLDFEVWASQDGTFCANTSSSCYATHTATMRNEISAMANKIEPNGNPGGQWFNTNAQTVSVGQTITTNGILYRLGNVNQGFDNNNDLVPDYNAWLQPIGNATYDPSCFRLIEVSGVLTVTRSSGNPDLIIPFSHALNQSTNAPLLYFTDLPTDNTDVNGLVYYTFMALGGPCTIPISPYQEVASGSENEKFNGDYGGGGPSTIQTYAPNITFDKSGPVSTDVSGSNFTYSISYTNNGATDMGLALSTGLNAGFVVSDAVPVGLNYVGGTAGGTPPTGNSYTIYYSTNSGLTWSTTDPGTVQSTATNRVMIQWWLNNPLGHGNTPGDKTGTATWQANAPGNYYTAGGTQFINNCAEARLGTGSPFAQDCAVTMVTGLNSLGDKVWSDNGGTTGIANNGIQDGDEAGITGVGLTLFWDKNNNGVQDIATDLQVSTTTSNGGGTYGFSGLPDGKYIVVVDVLDTDIPTGYGPTTPKSYAIDLDSAGTNPAAVANNNADFGFGPSLSLVKDLSTLNPAYVGETVQYKITLTNKLPGDGTANGFCQYTLWSPTEDTGHSGSGVSAWTTPANVFKASGPDLLYAFSNYSNNVNSIAGTSFTLGNQGGTITKVEALFRIYMAGTLTDDYATGYLYYNDTQQATTTFSSATLNTFGPSQTGVGTLTWDLTSARAWNFSDFTGTLLDLQFDSTKNAGVDGASLYMDGMALRVTTSQQCSGSDSTITELPLTDTYDPTYLQFVSADPLPSSQTAGTITWNNVGPLYGGGVKTVTVNFKALATVASTTNTGTSTNGKFGSGKLVNTATDPATVAINASGSIAGVVWAETNATNQWTNPTGYDGSDNFLSGVTVQLYGCYAFVSDVYQLLATPPSPSQSCTSTQNAGTWVLISTQATASNGSYLFSGLRPGYYNIKVVESTLPTGFSTRTGDPDPAGNGVGVACGTCDGQWNTDAANMSTFNNIASGESVTAVSFGYRDPDGQGAITGYVWNDRNANGIWDTGEVPIPNASVYLCSTTPCTSGTPGATLATTDSNGRYTYSNLNAGTYYVGVTLPSGMSQSGDPDFPNVNCGASCDNQTNAITLVARQVSGLYNFGYTGGLTIGDTVYTDWNGNGSQDSGEEGINGVQVQLYRDLNGNGTIDSDDTYLGTQTTNATGFYQFTNLAGNGNKYLVRVVSATTPSGYTQTADPDQVGVCTTCDNKQVVTLNTTSIDTSDFGYKPTGFASIGDYIWSDVDGDGIQDTTESGINGVVVSLYEDTGNNGVIDTGIDAVVTTATTASGGLYSFTGLYPGNYMVAVALTNFNSGQPLSGKTLTSTGAAYTNTASQVSYKVALTTGQTFTQADFGFTEGLIGDFIWRDDNANGTPDPSEPGIASVTVTLYNDVNGNGIQDGGDTFRASTTTSGTGYYTFGSLPAGNYVVVVTPPTNYTLTGDPDAYGVNGYLAPPCNPLDVTNYVACDHQYGVNLRAGQTDRSADFGYKPLGIIGDSLWIDGNANGIRDAGEAGIPYITVNLCADTACSSVLATTVTDSDGYYSFGGLNDGTYFVKVVSADTDWPVGLPTTPTFDPDSTLDGTANNIVISGGVVTSIGGTPCTNCDLNVDFGYRYTGNNTINGTIWHDTDAGGQSIGVGDIDTGEDYRYSGVIVYLWNCGTDVAPAGNACTDGDEVYAGSTTTNATGQYSFTSLADGTYAVTINPNTMPLTSLTPTTTTGYTGSTGTNPAAVLSGSTTAQRDFGVRSLLDFGDLPASYNKTLSAVNGPRHMAGTLQLGAGVNTDPNGQEDAGAAKDQFDDGLDQISTQHWTNGATVDVTIDVQGSTASGSATAGLWIDWNNNGTFEASDYYAFSGLTVGAVNTRQITVPLTGYTVGNPLFVRVRVFDPSNLPGGSLDQFDYLGYANNGEVEDYYWIFSPTAITLDSLSARSDNLAMPMAVITSALILVLGGFLLLRRKQIHE